MGQRRGSGPNYIVYKASFLHFKNMFEKKIFIKFVKMARFLDNGASSSQIFTEIKLYQ